jgi:FlaG/FlaF family flagellin (archaellin)
MASLVNRRDDAVSPVVGIMLMLVVTIIIAAVVSGFAGGLASGTDKGPQASISASFSQVSGLVMTHTGGDNLLTTDLQVIIRKSDEFGSAQAAIKPIIVEKSAIRTIDGVYWVGENGILNATSLSWQPGDSMFVVHDDLEASGIATNDYGGDITSSVMNEDNIGKTIKLEIYTKDGKMIASTSMVVRP